MRQTSPNLSRRNLLRALAASPVAAGAATFPLAARAEASSAATAAGLITPNVCLVMPEVTEGPYYIDPNLVRADITEDRTGIPLVLQMQVVNADCTPIEGARVDVWHCDAEGNYSGYANQGSEATLDTTGQTFLRGTQMTEAGGLVQFQTIYPGWYRGRTTHIHYKVFLDEVTVLTSQIFFPDALSQYLYDNIAPYTRESTRDTINASDGIAQQAGDGAYAALREQSEGYVAQLVVGVNPDAVSEAGNGGPGGAGGPNGAPPGPPPGDAGGMGPSGSGDWTPDDLVPEKDS